MMKSHMKVKNILAVILMVTLLAGMIPSAFAESFNAVVTSGKMKVYATTGSHKYLGSLSKGTVVTVLDYKKGIAKVKYNGKTGLAYVKDMAAVKEEENNESTMSVPAVALQKMKVYKKASTSSKSVTVSKGTEMTVIAVSGSFAKVEKNGYVGYALKKYLGSPEDVKVEDEKEENIQNNLNLDVVTNRSTRIYKKASTSSKYVTVPKGTPMTVVALNGECARVESNGNIGYAVKSHLSVKSDEPAADKTEETPKEETPKEEPKQEEEKKEETSSKPESSTNSNPESSASSNPIFNSGYSNEQITYLFLTKVMGYNTAAAVGIMGNIKHESGYKPVSNGDSGSSYGICQWHAGRKTRLINWCNENGYDHATLEGQLYYLQYDLTHSYTKVHKYLSAVENTAEGAYDAGYYFCYHFEGPSNKTAKSIERGEYCRDTLWERYGK